jgi:hypothetical protein
MSSSTRWSFGRGTHLPGSAAAEHLGPASGLDEALGSDWVGFTSRVGSRLRGVEGFALPAVA